MHAQTAIEIDYRKGGFCWSWWISMIGCLFVLFGWLVGFFWFHFVLGGRGRLNGHGLQGRFEKYRE